MPDQTPPTERKRFDLTGFWKLRHFLEGKFPIKTPFDLLTYSVPDIPAIVPGNVEIDMMASHEIQNPLVHPNADDLRPFEFHQFWYERTFDTPDGFPHPELVFEGIDCLADIWVNGHLIGSASNALTPHRFPLGDLLAPAGEENKLFVRIKSAMNSTRDFMPSLTSETDSPERLCLRKPAHCFGCNIMPRIVSAGIWRPVYIEDVPKDELDVLYLQTLSIADNSARLRLHFHLKTSLKVLQNVSLRIRGTCGDSSFTAELPVKSFGSYGDFTVQNPQLWWPAGYGAQNLYTVTVDACQGADILASRTLRFGIRTVTLENATHPDKDASCAPRLTVNGLPIFARGAAWLPADAIHARDIVRIPKILELFQEAQCNFIHCWGGNVYEPQKFFDICDEYGLLVCQDFALTSNHYPQTSEFTQLIQNEVSAIITALRQHPCLALWCGCTSPNNTERCTNPIVDTVIPNVLRHLDPIRPYLDYSPCTAPDIQQTSLYACPSLTSIKEFTNADIAHPQNTSDEDAGRILAIQDNIRAFFRELPTSQEDIALASQITQSENIKKHIESSRLNGQHAFGCILGNLMDGYPQFSSALVDYYFTRKLAFAILTHIYAPVLVMLCEEANGSLSVIAVNDTPSPTHIKVQITQDFQQSPIFESQGDIPAIGRLKLGTIPVQNTPCTLYIIRWDDGASHHVNHYLQGNSPFAFSDIAKRLPLLELPEEAMNYK